MRSWFRRLFSNAPEVESPALFVVDPPEVPSAQLEPEPEPVVEAVVELDTPDEIVIARAVLKAYLSVGLPLEQFSESFDLLQAGKIEQVYHLAARELGRNPEWNTVGDVIAALKQ